MAAAYDEVTEESIRSRKKKFRDFLHSVNIVYCPFELVSVRLSDRLSGCVFTFKSYKYYFHSNKAENERNSNESDRNNKCKTCITITNVMAVVAQWEKYAEKYFETYNLRLRLKGFSSKEEIFSIP